MTGHTPEGRAMDFIFMLTRDDRTVADGLELLDLIAPLGLKHIGFKDIGVPSELLRQLTAKIHEMGAISYMEVVSTAPEACLNSARAACDLGVKRLLGGTQVDAILKILEGTGIAYYPFPGKPIGHPTKLGGTPADVERDSRSFVEKGCAGCDLLAYRAIEADPVELVRAARRGLGPEKYLIVAGAVTSADQIREIRRAGADAFTIGSAIFNGTYSPDKGSIISQLRDVMAATEAW